MNIEEYRTLSDTDKIDFLRLMYSYVKEPLTETQAKCKELIIQETQLVYDRIQPRGIYSNERIYKRSSY